MDVVFAIVAIVLAILGVIGCVIPIVPGVIISYAGYLCLYFCDGSEIGLTSVIIYGILAVVVTIVDFILPSFFSKKFGGSKAGRRGATLGMIAGMLFSSFGIIAALIGLILFPCAGAIIGEIIHDKSDKKRAFKVGLGTFISFFVGTAIKLTYSIIILIHIFGKIWDMAVPHIVAAYDYVIDWFANLF